MWFAGILSHPVGCLITFLILSFKARVFIFEEINSFFPLVSYAFDAISKKSLPRPRSRRFGPMFSSMSLVGVASSISEEDIKNDDRLAYLLRK